MPWAVNECGRRGAVGAGLVFVVWVTWSLVGGGYGLPSPHIGSIRRIARGAADAPAPCAGNRAPPPPLILPLPAYAERVGVRGLSARPVSIDRPVPPHHRQRINCAAAYRRGRRTSGSG